MVDVLGIHHVGLSVASLQQACEFYNDLGFEVVQRLSIDGPDAAIGNGLPQARLDVAFLASGRLVLELIEFEPVGHTLYADSPAFGSVPVCSHGGPDRDPDGHRIEFCAADDIEFEVNTANAQRTSAAFELLGFGRSSDGRLAGHGAKIALRQVPQPGGSVMANAVGRMHVCMQVRDMEQACDQFARAGFPLVSTPRIHDQLEWVFVDDSSGPGIELLMDSSS